VEGVRLEEQRGRGLDTPAEGRMKLERGRGVEDALLRPERQILSRRH
jgi:hypothetical protein